MEDSGRASASPAGGEQILSALLEHSTDIIAVIGLDGALRYRSQAARRILGYDRVAPDGGADTFDYIHPDDRERAAAAIADALGGGVTELIELRVADADGAWRDIEFVVSNLLDDPAVAGLIVNGRDITERRRAEQQGRALLEASPDLIFRIARDGTYLDCHAGSLQHLARPPEAFIGRRVVDMMPPDLAEQVMAAIGEALGRGGVVEYEHPFMVGEDQRFFEVRIAPINDDEVLAISRDVTDRTQAEERLRASEARHRAFLAAKPDLMLRLGRDGTFLDYHAADPAQLQLSPAEFLGRTVEEIMPSDLATRTMAAVETAITTGRMVEFEYSLEMPDQVRWYEARVGRIDDDEAVTICRDVTERRHAEATVREAERAVQELRIERERQELAARLEQSQRLESLGRLAGGVAHDFNNLLGVILNYTRLVDSKLAAGSPACDDLAGIRAAAERGADLTHQLLLFGRPDTARPEVFDLRDLAADVVGLLGRTLGPDIELVHRPAAAPCPVEADRGRLDQVIVNLVLNGSDAMPEGGRVEIETVREEVPDHHAGSLGLPAGEYVVLRVRDAGTGMPAEIAARAFEPFFTTKPPDSGFGLGLSSVYGVVSASGGQVTIDTEEAKGTVMTVFLPTSPALAETGATDLARA